MGQKPVNINAHKVCEPKKVSIIKNDDIDDAIDEDNDIYPSHIDGKLIKVEGFNKIYYAIMYLKVGRLRKLLSSEDACEKDDRERNIINLVTQRSFSPGAIYECNMTLFERVMFTVLEGVERDILMKLFDTVKINEIFIDLSDRPHLLIALWDYGLKYDEKSLSYCMYDPIKPMLSYHMNDKFIARRRYKNLVDKCPITLQNIEGIAILTDGHAYEYIAIKEHLLRNDTSPMTGLQLVTRSGTLFSKIGDDCVGDIISAKTLYLPEHNIFEHFELVYKKK